MAPALHNARALNRSPFQSVQRAMKNRLARIGIEVRSIRDDPPLDRVDLVERVRPFTMTDRGRIVGLCDAVEYVVDHDIGGALVECGVWRGGSMMAAAITLRQRQATDRDLYLFDTFDGMVEPSEHDVDWKGVHAGPEWGESAPRGSGSDWCNASVADVATNMRATGYPEQRVHLIEGRVEETIPRAAPDKIAILRLDVDWHDATAHALEHLAGRVSTGGVIIFDDYVYWDGARKATDDWLARWPHPLLLTRMGEWGRMAVVQRASDR